MIILICGGRNWCMPYYKPKLDWEHEMQYTKLRLDMLQEQRDPSIIIHGDAKGADKFCADYMSETYRTPTLAVPADWIPHGNSAGPIRNKKMLNMGLKVERVIAFPGGSGTKNMMGLSRASGIVTIDLEDNWNEWRDEQIPY